MLGKADRLLDVVAYLLRKLFPATIDNCVRLL